MKQHWHWGTKIALVYGLFATGTLTMVAIAARQPVDLVAADYYERSLAVDARTQAISNAQRLGDTLSIGLSEDRRELVVSWPAAMSVSTGTVTLYRPADGRADQVVAVRQDARFAQRVDVTGLPSGFWRVHVAWTAEGRDYFATREVWLR